MMSISVKVMVLVALPVLIGVAEWHYTPEPPAPRSLRVDAEPWALPRLPKSQPDKALEILNKVSLWGKLPDAAVALPLNEPDWRFIGVVTSGTERFVMIKVDGQPEQRLTINDKLPGGSKILDIGADSLCVLVNGKKRNLAIYKQGPQVL